MFLFIQLFLVFIVKISLYSVDQHQLFMYTGAGYSKQELDTYQNIYDTPMVSVGLGYRWNKFLSRESVNYFSIGLGIGGGMIFSKLRDEPPILNYNSFLELEIFTGYGVGLGENKEHQISVLGISFLPKFYGLLERNNVIPIGGTEISLYDGFYIPISVGVHLPSYRYIYNRFFIGFQHSINIVVFGNNNINRPKESLILNSWGYQFRLEFGLNYDGFSSHGIVLEETTIFVDTNRKGITISLFAKIEKEEAKTVTVEIFALEDESKTPVRSNLIGYASKIAVLNRQAQFTKHWSGKNYFEEKMKQKNQYLYVVIKEIDRDDNILIEHFHFYKLEERKNEDR